MRRQNISHFGVFDCENIKICYLLHRIYWKVGCESHTRNPVLVVAAYMAENSEIEGNIHYMIFRAACAAENYP